MFGKLFGKKSKDGAPETPPAAPPAAPPPAPRQSAAPPSAGPAASAPPAAPPLPAVDPIARPAVPPAGGDTIAALSRTTQAGASNAADAAAVIEQTIRSGAKGKGAPITPDAVKALRQAAESLATATEPAAAQAIAAFHGGRFLDGFQILRQDADAQAGIVKVERLRRLGALSFLVDAGTAALAYDAAWALDQRDFWNGVYLARLQGLGGGTNLARETMHIAINEARTPLDRSQGEAELALIALGLNDAAGARRHGQAAVDVLRSADAPFELAGRLALLGDIGVMISDSDLAARVYGEGLAIIKTLGAQTPSDVTLARGAADTQEKLAAVISRQNRHDEAVAAGAEALDLRRRLATARPTDPVDVTAYATALNTCGEIHRLAGNTAAATQAYRDAVEHGRKAVALAPQSPDAHREVWVGLWRLARTGATPWRDVLTAIDAAKAAGALLDRDAGFLEEARRRAGGAA